MMVTEEVTTSRSSFLRGAKRAFSIVLGYVPIGIAYGMIATDSHIHPLVTMALSIMVFAGSSQFVAIGILTQTGAGLPLVITTFFVNFRHLLMSASLAPFLRKVPLYHLFFLGFGITDESFSLLHYDFEEGIANGEYMLGVNTTAYCSWILSTLMGIYLGNLLEDPTQLGLDFALPAMFIALLAFQMRGALYLLVTLMAGLISLLLLFYLPGGWNIILATIIAATLGVFLKRWRF